MRGVFAAILLLVLGNAAAPARTWTSGSGKTLEADFVKELGGTVYLKNAKGETFAIRLSSLSAADREYVRTRNVASQPPGKVVIYPAPGDLSGVAHLSACQTYTVKVNGQPCFVYYTDNYFRGDGPRPEKGASFALFSFAEPARAGTRRAPVHVEVECPFGVNSVQIRPTPFGIQPTVTGNKVSFQLTEPRKISVEINGRQHPLFIFADEVDEPNRSAKHYFGPGVHQIGDRYVIKSNQKVYLAGGAVVEGTLLIEPGARNVEIRGRGVLTGGKWSHADFQQSEKNDKDRALALISGRRGNLDRFTLEGLCLVNSPGWNVAIFGGDDRVYRNVKVIGWNGNTDGPWSAGDNGLMEDCFVFNNDDSLCLGYGSHWVYRNNVIWHGLWGVAIACRTYSPMPSHKDLLIENTYLIGTHQSDQALIWFTAEGPAAIVRKDFSFRNLRIEACDGATRLLQIKTIKKTLRNLVLENVTLDRRLKIELDCSAGGQIDGLHFINLQMAGTPVTSTKDVEYSSKGDVRDVTFK